MDKALAAGFVRARIARLESISVLAVALPITEEEGEGTAPSGFAEIAAFARKNYYREAVTRLKSIARELREADGHNVKSDYRIFCNSMAVDEKAIAASCGLGAFGRNGLILVPGSGSRVLIAVMRLPFHLAACPPLEPFALCAASCGADTCGADTCGADTCGADTCSADTCGAACGTNAKLPPCAAACPTGALDGTGRLNRELCIQWYLSGHSEPPPIVLANWGRRLYGCVECQRACPHNQAAIADVPSATPQTEPQTGKLPRFIRTAELIDQDDAVIKARFKGTALGLSWLTPAVLRRNAIFGI